VQARANPTHLEFRKIIFLYFLNLVFLKYKKYNDKIFFHQLSISHYVGFLPLLANDEITRAGSTIFYVKR